MSVRHQIFHVETYSATYSATTKKIVLMRDLIELRNSIFLSWLKFEWYTWYSPYKAKWRTPKLTIMHDKFLTFNYISIF